MQDAIDTALQANDQDNKADRTVEVSTTAGSSPRQLETDVAAPKPVDCFNQHFNNQGAEIKGSIVGAHTVNISVNHVTMASEQRNRKPWSVDNVKMVTPDFMETEKYHEAKRLVRESSVVILHAHGFPGTGKSEIVRKLATEFPYKDADVFVKWHIECFDSSHVVDQQLAGVLKQLKENQFEVLRSQGVREQLEKARAKPFVSLLRTLNVPVLIIIEDPKPSDYNILLDLMTAVNSLKHEQNRGEHFHVYITSRKNAVGGPRAAIAGLGCYTPLHVEGFSEAEGLSLLFGKESDVSDEERKAALRIISSQAGSPLGLTTVKTYCEKARISYEDYLEVIENDKMEIEVQQAEATQLREEYGNHFEHLFGSIVRLLKPKEGEDRIYYDTWEVMSALCFLHHGRVPRLLVGKIIQYLSTKTGDVTATSQHNLITSGCVISHLKDRSLCRVDGRKYDATTVTFHEVIFRAVRVLSKADSGHEVYVKNLQRALYALSAIVHKDLRKTKDNVYMNELAPQIAAALARADENFSLDTLDIVTESNFKLWMCVCHLGEVIGIVKSLGVFSLKKYAESCLEFAAKVVLKTVEALTGSTIDPAILQPGDNLDETGSFIARKCVEAGNQLYRLLPADLLNRYMSVVLQMKAAELEFLQKNAGNREVLNTVILATKKHVGLTSDMMENLRKCQDIFLDAEKHCSVFFAERLASILHTWGRCLLYYNVPIDGEMRRRYTWFSKLSNSISRQCHSLTGVHLLFENLTSISLNPIMLKGLSQLGAEERESTLLEAQASLTSLLSGSYEGVTFYEHGHIKDVDGAVYTQMILYRFLIRVNTKLLAFPGYGGREDFISDANQVYATMYRLAKDNISWIMAPKCLVYCGKFQAARGNYERATECFCEAIEAGIKQSNNLFAWATYNLARAVVTGQVEASKEFALAKCKEALKEEDDTDKDLVEKILEHVQYLQRM